MRPPDEPQPDDPIDLEDLDDLLRFCSSCEQAVAVRALRCAHCGAPFAGPQAVDRLRVEIRETADGVGVQIAFLPEDNPDT